MSWVYVILVETGSFVEILHYEPFLCYWWKFPSIFDNFYIIIVLDKCYPNIGKFSVIEANVIKAIYKNIFQNKPAILVLFSCKLGEYKIFIYEKESMNQETKQTLILSKEPTNHKLSKKLSEIIKKIMMFAI